MMVFFIFIKYFKKREFYGVGGGGLEGRRYI